MMSIQYTENSPRYGSGFFQFEPDIENGIYENTTITRVFNVEIPIKESIDKFFKQYKLSKLPVSEWGLSDSIYLVSLDIDTKEYHIEIYQGEKNGFLSVVNFPFTCGKEIRFSENTNKMIAKKFITLLRKSYGYKIKHSTNRFIMNSLNSSEKKYIELKKNKSENTMINIYKYYDKLMFRLAKQDSDRNEYIVVVTDSKGNNVMISTDINKDINAPFLRYVCEKLMSCSMIKIVPCLSKGYTFAIIHLMH